MVGFYPTSTSTSTSRGRGTSRARGEQDENLMIHDAIKKIFSTSTTWE